MLVKMKSGLIKESCRYVTNRLLVVEWHSISPNEWNLEGLENIVTQILTPKVTRSLPPSWQGSYFLERSKKWVEERDEEGTTLIVIEKSTKQAIGLVILLSSPNGRDYRLGYLLKESAWGKGFTSELVQGFVDWCQNHNVSSIIGGVEKGNIASKRVLEKSGFICESEANEGEELLYVLKIDHDK